MRGMLYNKTFRELKESDEVFHSLTVDHQYSKTCVDNIVWHANRQIIHVKLKTHIHFPFLPKQSCKDALESCVGD